MHIINCSPTLATESELRVASLPRLCSEENPSDGFLPVHSHSSESVFSTPQRELEQPEEVQHELLLTRAVKFFGTKWAWRVRTCLAVFCAIFSVLLDVFTELRYSCVVFMIVIDCSWLVYLLLIQPSYCNAGTTSNWLTKLLRVPFMFLSPTILSWFDFMCLLLSLVGFVIRDVFIMLFVMILSKCVHLHLSSNH